MRVKRSKSRKAHSEIGEHRFHGPVPAIVNDVLRSPGQTLDAHTLARAESHFHHGFSKVRIHTDAEAAQSARAVHSLAYTVGQDIVFAEGRYLPHSSAGAALLNHELTHVVQQGDAGNFSTALPLQRAEDSQDKEPAQDESPCEKQSLKNERDLPCPGSNDKSTWLKLPCAWTLFKNTGECGIGVAQLNAKGEIIQLDLIDPGESIEVKSVKGCSSLAVACQPDCSGKGHVKWGPPCIS